MGRRASRELAMKLLYQFEIQKTDKEEQIAAAMQQYNPDEKDRNYITDVLKGTEENEQVILDLIEKYSKNWKVDRISKVDLAILKVAIYEILFSTAIPVSVSINEAVELAKKYSGSESGAYINGLLGKVADDHPGQRKE